MTRTGKIARLPSAVRKQLNCRLLEGEPGKRLVAWLNGLPEVLVVLNANFGGRLISEQNLSEWKQGGFEEWRRQQEAVGAATTMLEEAERYEELAVNGALSDRLAEFTAVSLGHLLKEATQLATGPEKRRAVLGVVRELIQLRRTDRDFERSLREGERHEREKDDYLAEKTKEIEKKTEGQITFAEVRFQYAHEMKAEYETKGAPVPMDITEFLAAEEGFNVSVKRWRNRFRDGVAGRSRSVESDPIKPDQTKSDRGIPQ